MLQPLFCYFNPVIGATCSCWFLNSILFWKGQTTSLDTLSSYRAPRRWDFQMRSKSNHLSKMSHRFAARDPVWKGRAQGRGTHEETAEMWRAAGTLAMEGSCWHGQVNTDSSRSSVLCHAGVIKPITADRVFLFFTCGSTACRPGQLESVISTCSREVTPRGCVTDNVSVKQERRRVAFQKVSLQRFLTPFFGEK